MRLLLSLIALTLFAAVALAQCRPPTYIPARTHYAPAYTAPAYTAPTHHAHHDTYHDDFSVRISEAYYNVIDLNVRDLFVFNGPPQVIPPGLTLGVNAAGAEVTVPVGGNATPAVGATTYSGAGIGARNSEGLRTIVAEDASTDTGLAVLGYEEGVQEGKREKAKGKREEPLAAVLATFRAGGCAECHTQGAKPRGGVALMDASGRVLQGTDWNRVLAYVTARDSEPHCPPSPRARLTEAQVEPIRKLAGKR